MKTKILLSFLMSSFIVGAFGQKPIMELTFTAVNNGFYVPFDSIFVENRTQSVDTTLYASDTVLMLKYTTNIGDNEAIDENSLYVSQNYPNPFIGKTEFNLYLPGKENIKIIGRDRLGRELVHYENILTRGKHSFTFYAAGESYYLLTVTGKQTSQSIKMLNAGSKITNGKKCILVYIGNKGNESDFKSQKAKNNFVFSPGDELQYTGYGKTIDGIVGNAVICDSPSTSTNYEFAIIKGFRCIGIPNVTDLDGNVYNTVKIGYQCWMAENLKTTTYSNGTSIPNVEGSNVWSHLTSGSYVWYGNDITWKNKYGAFYNWFATVDTNGLCPSGWHVSTNYEWLDLIDFIGGSNSPHGNELKSCRQVDSPLEGDCNTIEHPRWNPSNTAYGTDNFGFSGIPGGVRSIDLFELIGECGQWWSSQENITYNVCSRILSQSDGDIETFYVSKNWGLSVRCIRDY